MLNQGCNVREDADRPAVSIKELHRLPQEADLITKLVLAEIRLGPPLRMARRPAHLFEASRRNGLEFLLDVIPSKIGSVDDTTTAKLIEQFYAAGVFPDWWKLEPMTRHGAWKAAIEAYDRHTRGIVVLGLDAPEE